MPAKPPNQPKSKPEPGNPGDGKQSDSSPETKTGANETPESSTDTKESPPAGAGDVPNKNVAPDGEKSQGELADEARANEDKLQKLRSRSRGTSRFFPWSWEVDNGEGKGIPDRLPIETDEEYPRFVSFIKGAEVPPVIPDEQELRAAGYEDEEIKRIINRHTLMLQAWNKIHGVTVQTGKELAQAGEQERVEEEFPRGKSPLDRLLDSQLRMMEICLKHNGHVKDAEILGWEAEIESIRVDFHAMSKADEEAY